MSDNKKDESFALRKKLMGGSLSLGYEEPLKIVRGEMQYPYDETGHKCLDACNKPRRWHSSGNCSRTLIRPLLRLINKNLFR
jgi:hypothetical protein